VFFFLTTVDSSNVSIGIVRSCNTYEDVAGSGQASSKSVEKT